MAYLIYLIENFSRFSHSAFISIHSIMSIRFVFRNERYIYANPYCIYNVYIKLKYVIPNMKKISPICLQHRQFHVTSRNFLNSPLDNNMKIDPNDPLVTKVRSDPQILASIQEFSQL